MQMALARSATHAPLVRGTSGLPCRVRLPPPKLVASGSVSCDRKLLKTSALFSASLTPITRRSELHFELDTYLYIYISTYIYIYNIICISLSLSFSMLGSSDRPWAIASPGQAVLD